MRVRLPVFALVGVGTVLIAVIPFPHDARREISIAGVLFFALVAAAFLVPWERLPEWAWLSIPIGYIAVIAIIRDAQGGSDSGLVVVYLLPIVWLSLYGRRLHLLVGLFCLDLALLVPLLIVGPPNYPTLEWRQVAGHGDRDDLDCVDRLHDGLARPQLCSATWRISPASPGATPARPTTPATASRPFSGPPPAAPSWGSTRPARSRSSPPAPSRCSATWRPRWWVSVPSPTSSTPPRSTSGARRSTPCGRRSSRSTPRRRRRCRGPPPARTANSGVASCVSGPPRADAGHCPMETETDEFDARERQRGLLRRVRPLRVRTAAVAGQRRLRRRGDRRDRTRGAGGRPRAAVRHPERSHAVAHRAEQPPARADPDEGRRRGHGLARVAHPDHVDPGFIELLARCLDRPDREPDAHAADDRAQRRAAPARGRGSPGRPGRRTGAAGRVHRARPQPAWPRRPCTPSRPRRPWRASH